MPVAKNQDTHSCLHEAVVPLIKGLYRVIVPQIWPESEQDIQSMELLPHLEGIYDQSQVVSSGKLT